MDTENGVLELWSNGGTRNGVKEYWSYGAPGPLCGAGPEAGAPTEAWEAGAVGKRWAGRRVQPGGSGLAVGRRTGLAHMETTSTRLGPDNSTQVVDFPRIEHVRLFWEGHEIGFSHGWNTDKTRMGTDLEQEKTEPSGAWNQDKEAELA